MKKDAATLILTCSTDVTTDLMQPLFRNSFLRVDLDLMHEHAFLLDGSRFEYGGQVYGIGSFRAVYWRKPSEPLLGVEQVNQLQEFEYLQRLNAIRAVSTIAKSVGVWHLVDPLHEHHYPKPMQLAVARKWFDVPAWSVSVGTRRLASPRVVSKAFSTAPVRNGRYLVTTRVTDTSKLSPDYTWFLQEEVDAACDATVVCCGDRMWAFTLRRPTAGEWVDWRLIPDNHRIHNWESIEVPQAVRQAIQKFCRELGVVYTRMDFLVDQSQRWWFLEANMNGQFAWLDPENTVGILSAVAAAAESAPVSYCLSE